MSEVATPARRSRRRRYPRYVRGLRRVAYVLAALAWLLALWSARGGNVVTSLGAAAIFSGVLALAWVGVARFSISGSNSVRHYIAHVLKQRKRRRLGKVDRAIQLVTWVAAGSAAWLVVNIPDYEPDSTSEMVVAMVLCVAVAVLVVQLLGWVLKGFLKSE